jgi:hypothetical protein
MNRRLVADEDPLNGVERRVDHVGQRRVQRGQSPPRSTCPGQLNVPVTPVLNGPDTSPDPWTHFYKASNLVSTVTAPVGCSPAAHRRRAFELPDHRHPVLTTATNGDGEDARLRERAPGLGVGLVDRRERGEQGRSRFGGGMLAAQMGVDRPESPAFLQLGLLNPVVQKTFKIVTETTSGSTAGDVDRAGAGERVRAATP